MNASERSLRHNAFERHPARLPEHDRAVLVEMVAVADRPRPLAGAEQAPEFRLALAQRQSGEVAPIEVQEVEDAVDETVALAMLEG